MNRPPTALRRLWRAWDAWWFEPTDRYQLGIFRMLLVGYLATRYLDPDFVARVMRYRIPVPLIHENLALWLTPFPIPLPQPWRGWLPDITELLLWTSALGILTRPSLFLLVIVNLHVQGLKNAFGYYNHASSLPSLFLTALAFAPGASAWSVDALARWGWRRWRAKGSSASLLRTLSGGPVPAWGARVLLVTLCFGYGASGLAKVRWGGPDWLDGETLAFYMRGESRLSRQQFLAADPDDDVPRWKDGVGLTAYLYGTGGTPLGRKAARSKPVSVALSIAAVVFECGFLIALLEGRWLILCLLGGVAFHAGIQWTMNIKFHAWMWCYLAFVDWRWPWMAWRRIRPRSPD